MEELTIHRLTTLSIEDFQRASEYIKKDVLDTIGTYDLEEFAIVELDISWKWNQAALQAVPQLGDGEYTRYFLMARQNDTQQFKIYEVYWASL
ncbi:MAG: hypothetical protein ACK5MV_08645 [Aminipila sp.]